MTVKIVSGVPRSFAVGLLVALAHAVACATSDPRFEDRAPTVNVFGDAGAEASAPEPTLQGCSGDLRHVLRADGSIERTCPAELGCYDASCIPACEAAARSGGSIGCDFHLATPVVFKAGVAEVGSQQCYTGIVVNTWDKAMMLRVSYGGSPVDARSFARIPTDDPDPTYWSELPADGLPPGKVAVLFLSDAPVDEGSPPPRAHHVQCPVPTAVAGASSLHRWDRAITGRGKTFHIETDVPASTYDIYPFGGAKSFAPSASLVLPTSAWGTNYLGASVIATDDPGSHGPNNWLQIIAKEDTTVTIVPSDTLPTTTLSASTDAAAPEDLSVEAFAPRSFHLGAGEYIQWNASGNNDGSVIAADKPVAVVTGNGGFSVGVDGMEVGELDAAHQQLMPVTAFGWKYAIGTLGAGTTRRGLAAKRGHYYRIVAAVDGTKLTFDPPDVPGSEKLVVNAGGVRFFGTEKPFVVESQDAEHPFYVAQYAYSCDNDPATGLCLGGPEFVNVLPPEQYLTSYVFYTDISYGSTALVVTRAKGPGGFSAVEIGCSGKVDGFVDVGSSGLYQTAVIDLRIRNTPNGACTNGLQTARSASPFGITVWGLDHAASYAYPAGGNIARINHVVVPAEPR